MRSLVSFCVQQDVQLARFQFFCSSILAGLLMHAGDLEPTASKPYREGGPPSAPPVLNLTEHTPDNDRKHVLPMSFSQPGFCPAVV